MSEEPEEKKPTRRQKLMAKHDIPKGITKGVIANIALVASRGDWPENAEDFSQWSRDKIRRLGYIVPSPNIKVGSGWLWSATKDGLSLMTRWHAFQEELNQPKKRERAIQPA